MAESPVRPGEFEVIARHFAPLAAGAPGALGLSDDAALLDVPAGHQLVTTMDTMVAGIHFLESDPPESVGAKLLAVNLSDLAAMGATPLGYLVSTAWPATLEEAWIAAFATGMGHFQAEHNVALLGGDTVGTPGPMTLSLTALGHVPQRRALRRNGAGAGDAVWVSGTIGDGALGLAVLQGRIAGLAAEHCADLAERYRRPRPRTRLGPALVGVASACIDISDGLAADLGHICETSSLGADIDEASLPLSAAAQAAITLDDAWSEAPLNGGDDYELLFTAPAAAAGAVEEAARDAGVAVTCIGRMAEGPKVRLKGRDGTQREVSRSGWRHF